MPLLDIYCLKEKETRRKENTKKAERGGRLTGEVDDDNGDGN